MGGRHRFAGEDKTVRPLLAAVVPVVAVCGMTVAVLIGSTTAATSTPRIEVPRFSATRAPTSVVALPVALPVGTPALRDVSGAGASAVARLDAERAAARAESERAATREAEAREARETPAPERPAPQRPAQDRPAAPVPTAPERTEEQERPSTPQPRVTDRPDTGSGSATPERPRGLLGSLLGG